MVKLTQRNLIYAAGIILAVVLAVVLLPPRGTGATSQLISPAAYQQQFASGSAPYLLIDVRTPEEFASGHIHGAVNIPVDELANRLNEVPKDEPVVVYCHSGNRSSQAAKILVNANYTAGIYDLGGINTWSSQGFPIE